ncbi:MAG: PLP-dependent transferase [bacterium]|nr:PLP-dependent transferase [bacterium]
MSQSNQHFQTLAVRAGVRPDPRTGAVLTPIYQATTFVRNFEGDEQEFSYSRVGNPTVAALEEKLGTLESAPPAVCFSTGMSAITTLCLALLKAGDRVVASDVVYGGTFRLLRQVLENFDVRSDFVDTSDPGQLRRALREPARLLILEPLANPTLKVSDLAACVEIGREAGALVVVDNTFLTPALQRPLEHGADLVVHSTTKYLDGHNATVGGAICSRDESLLEQLRLWRKSTGTIQTPFQAWLTLQGVKTLSLRMAQHSRNALRVARWLEGHPDVAAVRYPGLESFVERELAARQQSAGGGMLNFVLKGDPARAQTLLRSVKLCYPAENLGAVETLITHPATMTHDSIPPETRRSLGIGDGLLRLSVGIEDPQDIIADLEQAIAVAVAKRPSDIAVSGAITEAGGARCVAK